MSDIEQRAWDALIKAKKEEGDYLIPHKYCVKAMCREIEAHDATKAELAELRIHADAMAAMLEDVVYEWDGEPEDGYRYSEPVKAYRRFIQPDPLYDALFAVVEMGRYDTREQTQLLRAELAKRGLTITQAPEERGE